MIKEKKNIGRFHKQNTNSQSIYNKYPSKKKPTQHHTDFTSFAHDDLIEYAQPHDIPVFAPEPHIPYLPVDLAYENHYPAPHYGPPLLNTPHSHITNYISTDRKGKSIN